MWDELDRREASYATMAATSQDEAVKLGARLVLTYWPEFHTPASLTEAIRRLQGLLFIPTIPGSPTFTILNIISLGVADLTEMRDRLTKQP